MNINDGKAGQPSTSILFLVPTSSQLALLWLAVSVNTETRCAADRWGGRERDKERARVREGLPGMALEHDVNPYICHPPPAPGHDFPNKHDNIYI